MSGRISFSSFLLWLISSLFLSFQFVLRMTVGVLREEIMTYFNADIIAFGSLAGFYYVGYAGMQVPVGILLDRFSFKAIVVSMIMLTVIGTLAFLVADNWYSVLLGRFLIGAGSAAGFVSTVKAVSSYIPKEKQSIMFGTSITIGFAGAVFGGVPLRAAFDQWGYKTTFVGLCIIGVLLSLFLLLIKDKKANQNKNKAKDNEQISGKQIIKLLLNPWMLFIGICAGLMVGALEGFADVWAIPFFNQIHNLSTQASIMTSTLIFIGMGAGGPLLALIIKHFKSINHLIFLTGVITCAIFGIVFVFTSMHYIITFILMLILGVACCYQMLVFILATEIVGEKYSAMASSLINCIIMSFGYFFHRSISLIIHFNSDGNMLNDATEIYSYWAYIYGLSIIPISCLIGQFGFLYVDYMMKRKKISVNL